MCIRDRARKVLSAAALTYVAGAAASILQLLSCLLYTSTPKDFVFNKLSQGISVILEIEMQGALKVKERYPETVLIFVTPPTAEELEARLRGRGTETEEVILSRLSRASEEVTYIDVYKRQVVCVIC